MTAKTAAKRKKAMIFDGFDEVGPRPCVEQLLPPQASNRGAGRPSTPAPTTRLPYVRYLPDLLPLAERDA
jgi:hypothetical protein